jgi:GDP-mannose 6-dehydrogenase
MRPGTMDELIAPTFELALNGRVSRVELIYNPEFLRESVAIDDFCNPPKVVIGARGGARSEPLDVLNEKIRAPVFYTEYKEAELTKFVDNTFHAVKVAFANEIGRICNRLGICAQTTYEIFVSDTKLNISPHYFRPGGAFGGSCLPKDVRALQQIAADLGANALLVDSLIRSNEAHKHFLFERCVQRLEAGARVLMLGLAFKTDSDDLRESPNIDLARKLLQTGFDLSIYDPHVEPAKLIGQNLGYAFSNLPTWRKLLVSKAAAEAGAYDLVVDTKGWARKMTLASARVLDLSQME